MIVCGSYNKADIPTITNIIKIHAIAQRSRYLAKSGQKINNIYGGDL